jgi:hypothetical protein
VLINELRTRGRKKNGRQTQPDIEFDNFQFPTNLYEIKFPYPKTNTLLAHGWMV